MLGFHTLRNLTTVERNNGGLKIASKKAWGSFLKFIELYGEGKPVQLKLMSSHEELYFGGHPDRVELESFQTRS